MKILLLNFLVILILLTITLGCGSNPKLYRSGDKERVFIGELSDIQFEELTQILEAATSSKMKDTIIIKYDYNNEICWNRLDYQKKSYINEIITQRQQQIQYVLDSRLDVSVFNFREPGDNINKIKRWDDSILLDTDSQLFNLLFNQRSQCGNSMLILPDKRFILIRSDSHNEVMNLTQSKIEEILNS